MEADEELIVSFNFSSVYLRYITMALQHVRRVNYKEVTR